MFLEHNVHCTGAVTEGQQTSSNFRRTVLQPTKKHCINEESTDTVK